jgi:hypothetical protein
MMALVRSCWDNVSREEKKQFVPVANHLTIMPGLLIDAIDLKAGGHRLTEGAYLIGSRRSKQEFLLLPRVCRACQSCDFVEEIGGCDAFVSF